MTNKISPIINPLYQLCSNSNDKAFSQTLPKGLTIHMKIDTKNQPEKFLILTISRPDVEPSLDEWHIVKKAFNYPFNLPDTLLTHKEADGRYWIKGQWEIAEIDLNSPEYQTKML